MHAGGIAATNGYFVQTAGGNLAIDAPEGFADWLRQRGHRVDALLLTHQHFDHVMDAARIAAEHGCPTFAFSSYSKKLTLEDLYSMGSGVDLSVPPFTVDHLLEGKDTLDVTGLTFKLHYIPGHSLDSVVFHHEPSLLLFAGDVLFAGSVGRTDLPDGDGVRLLTGIHKRLMPLPDQTRVLPGHGPATTIGEERETNPYL